MAFNYKLVFLILALLVSFESHALVKAVGLTNTIKTAALGMTTRAKFVSTASGNVYTKVIEIGVATVGAVISKRAFSPWAIGITAAIIAAGYILDEDEQTISSVEAPSGVFGGCYAGNNWQSSSTFSDCAEAVWPGMDWGVYVVEDFTTYWKYTYKLNGNPTTRTWRYLVDTATVPALTEEQVIGGEQILLDTQIATEILPQIATAELDDLLIDPETGLPDEVITEIQTVANDIQTEEDLLNDADPNNDPVPSPTATIEEELLTDALTGSQDEQEQVDPCDENPNRVGRLDAGTFPVDPTVITEQVPFSVSQYSLTSTATCPNPIISSMTYGQDLSFTFQPFCNFATMLNPFIQALGFFIATMIVANSVRGGES